jgi:excisionase family DNA binding protein
MSEVRRADGERGAKERDVMHPPLRTLRVRLLPQLGAEGLKRAEEQRLALSPSEAAAMLGVSRDFFDEHIAPELRIVRRGRRKLIAVRELEGWLERESSLVLG